MPTVGDEARRIPEKEGVDGAADVRDGWGKRVKVAIAGGHGQVARLLARRLSGRGDEVLAIIRSPQQADDVRVDGGQPIVLDLEHTSAAQLAETIDGVDAVIFAAGAGPGSGAARKETVDYGAAVTLLDAARHAGVRRYVMISAMGADDPPDGDDVFSVYLRAKARADQALVDSELEWTIVRPGRLTDDAATGRVAVAERLPRGAISRDDVAAVVVACLDHHVVRTVLAVTDGDTPIQDAVSRLAS